MKEKLNELFKLCKVECVLLRNFKSFVDKNFFYFTQIKEGEFENNFLILFKNKKPLLLTSPLEAGSLKEYKNFSIKIFDSEKKLIQLLKKNLKGKKVGVNASIYPVNAFKKLKKNLKKKKFIDVSKALEKCRETKTKKEIKKIKKACAISEKAAKKIPSLLKKNKSEKRVALELEALLKKYGAQDLAFPIIVAFGKNAQTPHHVSGNKKLCEREIVLVDFGARFQNYCADLTRCFVLGKASKKQKKIYSIVREAQEKAISLAKPGVKAKDLFKAANAVIQKKLKKKMLHSLGHGLGLETHDFPGRMSAKSSFTLREGMILTIEPGYYSKSFGGIRIEDDVLITKNGCKKLSNAPKKLIELKV